MKAILVKDYRLPEFFEIDKMAQIKPVVDGPFGFDKILELIQYYGGGRHFGKIVVEIEK
jgi:NADPH:quinone reductase-like Zn-dependent oxidoreductase